MDGAGGATMERAFHHASALQGLVDLIEDGLGGDLLIEAGPRRTHHQRRTAGGAVTRVVQAMSIPESCSVISSDLWGAVRRWSGIEAPEATFVLHADGPLFPTAVVAVTNRLHRFSEGCATAEDLHVAKVLGLPADSRILRHVRLRCAAGPASALRSEVRRRVRGLIRPGSGDGRQEADEATDRLLRRCAGITPSGGVDVVTREDAASIAGVDVDALEGAGSWDPELASRYRFGRAAGAGAGEPDVIPVSVDMRHAVVAGLHAAIRCRVEAVSGRWLSATGARQILASPNLVLQLEGAGEPAGPGTLLAEELRVAREENPSMQVVAIAPDSQPQSAAPVAEQA